MMATSFQDILRQQEQFAPQPATPTKGGPMNDLAGMAGKGLASYLRGGQAAGTLGNIAGTAGGAASGAGFGLGQPLVTGAGAAGAGAAGAGAGAGLAAAAGPAGLAAAGLYGLSKTGVGKDIWKGLKSGVKGIFNVF